MIVLEELGLEYESKELNMIEKEHKSPDYLKINPNGQVPALVDHQNNDFVVWCVLLIRDLPIVFNINSGTLLPA